MNSLRPVLAEYRLVRYGPCMCLPSICVKNLSVAHCSPWSGGMPAQFAVRFLTFYVSCFWFPTPIRGWALHFFRPIFWLPSFPAISLCHLCCNDSILLGLFRLAVYSFLQWLNMTIGFSTYGLLCPFCFSLGHPWPICFLWASLTLLLILHSHGILLTSLDFPGPIILFSFLEFMGLPLTPYFLCLHYFRPTVAHSHFSKSYTAHEYAISLFPGFFKPIYLLKAHLFISWACDLLFMSLGPNGFTTYLPTLCCSCGWVFFFLLGFSKMTINKE